MNNHKKPNPSSERSKKWLTASLLNLMNENPYSKITIQDISKNADLVRQTFYKNFDTKDDILENYIGKLLMDFGQNFLEENKCDMKNFITRHINFWSDNSEFLSLLIKNNLTYLLDKQYKNHIPKLIDVLMQKKIDTDSANHKYALAYLSGAIVNVLVEWIYSDKDYSIDELSDLINIIIKGQYFYNL